MRIINAVNVLNTDIHLCFTDDSLLETQICLYEQRPAASSGAVSEASLLTSQTNKVPACPAKLPVRPNVGASLSLNLVISGCGETQTPRRDDGGGQTDASLWMSDSRLGR